MRITAKQHSAIQKAAQQHFGPSATVWLFGSRVNDAAKGGDYDLLIEADLNAAQLIQAKLAFLVQLHSQPCLEDEKIDVVLSSPQLTQAPAIVAVAKREGMIL
ncbi:nucleotidyltransferase domain-containing protein [Deefgea salmonis]|uniref:Nucleotidyltransferase domain-containing protein n=1 Tax=Deefgea salmonis TaxID=2875502 RepID=A0ABS8BK61_9NEIS|nr:nucleotidyltransferase domain-containing protein [Deefgea salmonis]MCB5196106.1 nucleotidyltransferase domain-containing protein [Deefgea salmonis]